MTISLSEFLAQLAANPVLAVTVALTLGVVLVNGWTDAPNAIATCVSTRAMSARSAILMAAVFNFLGVLVMTMVNASVAATIYNMVDFGGNTADALTALCAALVAIVAWATAAWWFGIPTSESHALIAGLSGAAIALHGGFAGINGGEWIKVLYGLVLSTLLGFAFGWAAARLVEFLCKNMDRRRTTGFFGGAQIAGGAAMAFMHGAQDGQKFMGVFMLGIFLANGQDNVTNFQIPLWLMVLCSAVMALGTSIGGYRIIKAVFLADWHPCFNNAHQDHRHYGRGRGAAAVQRELGRGKGNGADVGADVPRVRGHWLFDGTAVHVAVLRIGRRT